MIYLLILAFSLALWPVQSEAAIACTGESFPFNVPTDPQAQNYTVPSVTNGITIIGIGLRSAARSATSATIGGQAMTEIGSVLTSANTAGQVFYRLNVSSGVQSISVDFENTPLSYVLTAITCEDVNQAAPFTGPTTATGSGTTLSVVCASAVGQLVLDFINASNGGTAFTPGAGQTMFDQDTADSTLSSGSSYEDGAASVTMSHSQTSAEWTSKCISLASASAVSRRAVSPQVF